MATLEYYGVYKSLMYMSGMYPLAKDANVLFKILYKAWQIFILANLILITTLAITDIALMESVIAVEIGGNIINIAIFIGGIFRALYYYTHLDEIKNIFEIMSSKFVTETDECVKDINIKQKIKSLKKFDLVWRLNVIFTVEIMVILPPILRNDRKLPLPAWMPWNWKTNFFLYTISIGYEVWNNFLIAFVYPNADLFFMSATILTAYQFDILGENYKNCVYTALYKCGFNKEDINAFKKSLRTNQIKEPKIECIESFMESKEFLTKINEVFLGYIKRHQELLNLCQILESFFAPIILLCIGLMVLYSIFMAYCLAVVENQNLFLFLQYLFSSILQLFMISMAGQTLTSSTEELRVKVYDIPWYILDKKLKYGLLITLMRLLKPVRLTAGNFIIISYNSFVTIMRTIYSFFALLQQTTRKG